MAKKPWAGVLMIMDLTVFSKLTMVNILLEELLYLMMMMSLEIMVALFMVIAGL